MPNSSAGISARPGFPDDPPCALGIVDTGRWIGRTARSLPDAGGGLCRSRGVSALSLRGEGLTTDAGLGASAQLDSLPSWEGGISHNRSAALGSRWPPMARLGPRPWSSARTPLAPLLWEYGDPKTDGARRTVELFPQAVWLLGTMGSGCRARARASSGASQPSIRGSSAGKLCPRAGAVRTQSSQVAGKSSGAKCERGDLNPIGNLDSAMNSRVA